MDHTRPQNGQAIDQRVDFEVDCEAYTTSRMLSGENGVPHQQEQHDRMEAGPAEVVVLCPAHVEEPRGPGILIFNANSGGVWQGQSESARRSERLDAV